jgi:hypothetical protein
VGDDTGEEVGEGGGLDAGDAGADDDVEDRSEAKGASSALLSLATRSRDA